MLIRQLQEQHYVQYMQQIFQQHQQETSRHTVSQQTSTSELPLDVEAAALNALAGVQNNLPPGEDEYSEGSGDEQEGEYFVLQ